MRTECSLPAEAGNGNTVRNLEVVGTLVAVEDALEQVSQTVGVLRAHDHVDLGDTAQQSLTLLLGNTPSDDDRQILATLFA